MAGSVTLRVALVGAPEVKAALASLGPAGADALRQIEAASKGPSTGMLALNAAGKEVSSTMQGLAGNAGALGGVLTAVGPAGLAAAAGIGAAIAAVGGLVDSTMKAMDFAVALETSAKAAGVSTTTLQQYRYAASDAGVAVGAVDAALGGFTQNLGKAEGGSQRQLKFFQAIFGSDAQDVLKSFASVDDALDATVDKIAGVGNAASRAAIAKGLGLEELTPLLADGSAKIEQLRADALQFGDVMDGNVVKSLADTKTAFDHASTAISVQFMSALVDIAPLLLQVMQLVASLAKNVDDFVEGFKSLQDRSTQSIRDDQAKIAPQLGRLAQDQKNGVPNDMVLEPLMAREEANHAELQRRGAMNTGVPNNQPNNIDLSTKRGGGKAPDGAERSDQVAGQLDAANAALLTAQAALTGDIQAHADLEKQAIQDEASKKIAADAAETAKIDADKTITPVLKKQLDLELQHVDALTQQAADDKKAKIDRDALQAATAQALADNKEINGYYDHAAQVMAAMALTADERNKYETQNLLSDQFLARLALKEQTEAAIANAGTDQGREQATRVGADKMNGLLASQGADRQALALQQQGPLAAWRTSALKATADVNTSFQNIAVDGLNAFNQGLFDSQGRLNSLGAIAQTVFSTMLKDLEQYLLKQDEIGLTGGGGFLGQLFGGSALGGPASSDAGFNAMVGLNATGNVFGWNGPDMVTSPTLFRFAKGGALGMMGEAGPEGILPLSRGPDGKLGVHAGGMGGAQHIDARTYLSAPGADPAQLMRLSNAFDDYRRAEPQRWAAYYVQVAHAKRG